MFAINILTYMYLFYIIIFFKLFHKLFCKIIYEQENLFICTESISYLHCIYLEFMNRSNIYTNNQK